VNEEDSKAPKMPAEAIASAVNMMGKAKFDSCGFGNGARLITGKERAWWYWC